MEVKNMKSYENAFKNKIGNGLLSYTMYTTRHFQNILALKGRQIQFVKDQEE